jgi:4-amino-4-deoxy-L-arabinose transferase-like glycosyltransferase
MHRYGTPLTAGLFLVSAVSGVALFFHWASATFHSMHEWLSMLLLAPFALHLWKNWKPLLAYARRKTLLIPLLLAVVVAVPFALTAGKGGRAGNPAFQTVALLTRASLIDLAPVFQSTPETLLQKLQQRGYKATSTSDSPSTVASASAVSANEVLFSLMPARNAANPESN